MGVFPATRLWVPFMYAFFPPVPLSVAQARKSRVPLPPKRTTRPALRTRSWDCDVLSRSLYGRSSASPSSPLQRIFVGNPLGPLRPFSQFYTICYDLDTE